MDTNYLRIDRATIVIEESELKLIGALLVAVHNAHECEQKAEQVNQDSSPLEKHSAFLKKSEALNYEAEIYRLLSCLYESMADRPVCKFLDELVELIK